MTGVLKALHDRVLVRLRMCHQKASGCSFQIGWHTLQMKVGIVLAIWSLAKYFLEWEKQLSGAWLRQGCPMGPKTRKQIQLNRLRLFRNYLANDQVARTVVAYPNKVREPAGATLYVLKTIVDSCKFKSGLQLNCTLC